MGRPKEKGRLSGLVKQFAAAIDLSTTRPIDFKSIAWDGVFMNGKFGGGKSKEVVKIIFGDATRTMMGACTVCRNDIFCAHAKALLLTMVDNDMAEAIEERDYQRTSFSSTGHTPGPKPDAWKRRLGKFVSQFDSTVQRPPEPATFPAGRELIYVINPTPYPVVDGTLTLFLATRPAGGPSHPPVGPPTHLTKSFFRKFNGGVRGWAAAADPLDRELAQLMSMIQPATGYYDYGYGSQGEYRLDLNSAQPLIARLARSGRLYAKQFEGDLRDDMPLIGWLSDEPFELKFEIAAHNASDVKFGLRAVNSELTLAHGQIRFLHQR